MRKLRDRIGPLTADDYLRLAIHSASPTTAAAFAEKGLRGTTEKLDPEVSVLLLREVFRAHLHARRLRSAHAVARKMVRLGALPEITHTDLGRACTALGWWVRAAQAFRIAARHAPARRRAMHWASVATALHHAGQSEDALSALERATRWSLTTRPLHRAYAALVHLDAGELPDTIDGLAEITRDLECARCGEGYGRYVVGLLYSVQGDDVRAMRHLRHFLRRNLGDPMREVTLAAEIHRARKTLRALRVRAQGTPSTPAPQGTPGVS